MPLSRFGTNPCRHEKAQSFVEVAIALPVLLILLSGLVEFGFLLNQYLNLIDGPREAARQANGYDYCNANFFINVEAIAAGCPSCAAGGTAVLGAINPMTLNPATDDVLVSIYQATCSGGSCSVSQVGSTHSWSQDIIGPPTNPPNATSRFTPTRLSGMIGTGGIPYSEIILVELFYKYHMVLGLPWLTGFLGNIISVNTYTIMPISIPTCS